METTVKWNGTGMSFEGLSVKGYSVGMGGKEEKEPSPMELLLIALGGCTGMDCMLVMSKKKMDVRAFQIKFHTERAETFPQKYTKIEMEYIFEGVNLDPVRVQKAVDLSANKYCSVKGSLDPAIEFVTTVTIHDLE